MAKDLAYAGCPVQRIQLDLFIDADCEVKPQCPNVESVERPGKFLYAAMGFSGRLNAGVMIVKNSVEAITFYRNMLLTANSDVPAEDQAPYENGHFIHYGKSCNYLHVLDSIWNNNKDPMLNDYIRHYTGPMRKHYQIRHHQKIARRVFETIIRVRNKYAKLVSREQPAQQRIQDRLRRIYEMSCKKYRQHFALIPWDSY